MTPSVGRRCAAQARHPLTWRLFLENEFESALSAERAGRRLRRAASIEWNGPGARRARERLDAAEQARAEAAADAAWEAAYKRLLARRRREDKSLRRRLALLDHATTCESHGRCRVERCGKLKLLIAHGGSCGARPGACPMCDRLWQLLRQHAERCRSADCAVPACAQFKDLYRSAVSNPSLRYVIERRRRREALLTLRVVARRETALSNILNRRTLKGALARF